MFLKEFGKNISNNYVLDQSVQKIRRIDAENFPEEIIITPVVLKKLLKHKDNIISYAERDGERVGYIAGMPITFFDPYREDPDLVYDASTLYVWSMAVTNGNFKDINRMCKDFIGQANIKGYEKISMHLRNPRLSQVLERRYGAKKLREIEDWDVLKETVSYLELNLKQ